MPGYSVVVFFQLSNPARLPVVGVGSVVKETVGKRKKPVTVTTHTSKTTGGKKTNRKVEDKGN